MYNSFSISNCLYINFVYKHVITRLIDGRLFTEKVETSLDQYIQAYKKNYYNVKCCSYFI